jgi:hypothetical protein
VLAITIGTRGGVYVFTVTGMEIGVYIASTIATRTEVYVGSVMGMKIYAYVGSTAGTRGGVCFDSDFGMKRDFYFYSTIGRSIFVTERAETPFRKLFLGRSQAGTAFRNFSSPAIDITRLGESCYPTALLSNKLAQRPLKFQRVTANNSLDFVQFLKKTPPPPTEFWVNLCVPEPISF